MVALIKFAHIVSTLVLLSTVFYGVRFATSPQVSFSRLNKIALSMAGVAMLTGTLLVYPSHFTFHTPWIRAAYLLLVVFVCGIFWLNALQKKPFNRFQKSRRLWQFSYFSLAVILIFVIHDAVSKSTFIF